MDQSLAKRSWPFQNMPHFSSPASHDEAQDLPDAASSAMKDMSTMIRGLGGKQTHFRY